MSIIIRLENHQKNEEKLCDYYNCFNKHISFSSDLILALWVFENIFSLSRLGSHKRP